MSYLFTDFGWLQELQIAGFQLWDWLNHYIIAELKISACRTFDKSDSDEILAFAMPPPLRVAWVGDADEPQAGELERVLERVAETRKQHVTRLCPMPRAF